jgi:hypothetical protein
LDNLYKSDGGDNSDQLSQVYFALQSITQGVAVYFLAYNIYETFFDVSRQPPSPLILNHLTIGIHNVRFILSAVASSLCSLLYIVFITFEYLVCYAGFWIGAEVGLIDIYIAVGLGMCQVFPMFVIGEANQWCAAVIPLGFVGTFAYFRSLFWTEKLKYNSIVIDILTKKTKSDIFWLMVANVICLIALISFRTDRLGSALAQIIISSALAAFCVYRGIRDDFLFKRLRRYRKGEDVLHDSFAARPNVLLDLIRW